MKITIDTNWWGKFRIYEGENYDYSYYGYSLYTFCWGDYGVWFNRDKERALVIKKRYFSKKIFSWGQPTYLIEIISSKENLKLECVDFHNGHWTIHKNDDRFDLRSVNENQKSLFKNDIKIASYFRQGIDQVIESDGNKDIIFLASLYLAFKVNND